MPKHITSSEAQNNFGAVMRWAESEPDGVIVERHGKPTAAIISYAEYQELTEMKEQNRRECALKELRALREEIQQYTASDTLENYAESGFSPDVAEETRAADDNAHTRS